MADTGIPLLEVPKTQNQLFNAFYMEEYYLIADAAAGSDFDLPPPTSWRKYFEFNQTKITDRLTEEYDLSVSDLGGELDAYMWENNGSIYDLRMSKPISNSVNPKLKWDLK